MKLFEQTFDTLAEASAFIEGVEFGGPGDDVGAHEPRQINGQWTVYVHDWTYESVEDVCPICGAGSDSEAITPAEGQA